MLNKSAYVPTFYLHQFWHTAQVNLDDESFTVTLDRQVYTVDLEVLRTVLLLPRPKKDYAPILSELEILNYIIDLGYVVQDNRPLVKHSKFDVKFLSQPWRTLYLIIVRSVAGRQSGHEHPRLQHL